MAKPFAIQFYKSKAWQKCRAAYIQSVFGLCERCQRPGDILHHKELLTPANINDPNITLNWENLKYLCQECHNREHGGSSTVEGLRFDAVGNLIQTTPPRYKKLDREPRDRGGNLRKPRKGVTSRV